MQCDQRALIARQIQLGLIMSRFGEAAHRSIEKVIAETGCRLCL
jgi:hypothetical protein